MSENKLGLSPTLASLAEGLLPWQLTGSSLGAGEDDELAKRRAMPVTLTDSKGKSMAGKSIIEAAKKGLALVKNNPTVMTKVNDYYKSATGTTLSGSNLIKGPAPAAVILKGLVRAGVNPSDVFDGVVLREQADAATAAIMDDLRNVFNSMTSALDSKAAIHSEGGLGQALLRKEVILFAQRSFGSVQSIRETHAKMRAFLEMDTRTLEETLALHLGR